MKFYASIDHAHAHQNLPTCPIVLNAPTFWRGTFRRPRLPPNIQEIGADHGTHYDQVPRLRYRYTPQQFVDWLHDLPTPPLWAATIDYGCDFELVKADPGAIQDQQAETTASAWHFWQHHREVPWQWWPTIHGWMPDSYREHITELRPLIHEMHTHYGANFRLIVGTLNRYKAAEIRAILEAVTDELPGVLLHCRDQRAETVRAGLPANVRSIDASAWQLLTEHSLTLWQNSHMTQEQYACTVLLPAYITKTRRATTTKTAARKRGRPPK